MEEFIFLMQIWKNTDLCISLEAALSSRIWRFNICIDWDESLFSIHIKLLSFTLQMFSIYLNILSFSPCFSICYFKHLSWFTCMDHNSQQNVVIFVIYFTVRAAVSSKGGQFTFGIVVQSYTIVHVCGMYSSNIYQCIRNVHWNNNNAS